MKTIKINDITFRDIFQNIDSRDLDKKKLLSVMEDYSGLEYDSLEILGGSSFEKILGTNLDMNPFQISSFVKSIVPSIPLQALIGARNLIGPEIYDSNIIKKFIKESIKNGISIFRVYDSLNDIENFKFTVSEILSNGARCQGTIIFDDLQDIRYYPDTAKELIAMGCSSICIKDAESTMIPGKAAELFSLLSKDIDAPVYFSASNLRGLQTLNYFEAAINGCNGFDLSFLPSSYNDLTPTVFSFLLSLKGTNISYKVDYEKVTGLGELIKKNIYPHIKLDLFSTRFILDHTNKNLLPKWLITEINNQLVEINEIESLDHVLEEVSRIKNEIGNPSLSTPVGQIVGSQAVLNSVISDNRWEILSDEIKKLIWGYYGKLPREIDKDILNKIEPFTERDRARDPSETKNLYKECRKELEKLTSEEGDILSYCFFPEKTTQYLKDKNKGSNGKKQKHEPVKITRKVSEDADSSVPLSGLKNLDIKKLKEITSLVESSSIDEIRFELDDIKISISNLMHARASQAPQKTVQENTIDKQEQVPALEAGSVEVISPIVGTFYSSSAPGELPFVKAGDSIKKGDTLFIVEAMKHMNRVISEFDGVIGKILVQDEEAVEYDQTIMIIKKD